MPKIQLIEVVDSSPKNIAYPPENLIRRNPTSRWVCRRGETNHMITATFRLPKPTIIGRIDIGNHNSASVAVLVSRNGGRDFKEILSSRVMRSEADCRNGKNPSGVALLTCSDLKEDTRHESWELIQVVCNQPYRRPEDDPFGLSFISVFDAPNKSPVANSLEKFKESALRTSFSAQKEINFASNLTRAQKMVLATKTSPSPPVQAEAQSDDDLFKATVISFIESNANIVNSKSQSDAKSELIQKLQAIMGKKFNLHESKLFSQIFRSQTSSIKLPSGILTPRTSNNQLFSSPGSKKMEDTKMSLFKPQNDSFNSFNTQTVYWAEVVHNHGLKDGSVAFMGRSGKENTPYLLEKNGLTNEDTLCEDSSSVLNSDKKICLDQPKPDKFSPRDNWKSRNDIDKCDSRDCSPDAWLKRKSDLSGQPINKKRPRDNASVDDSCNESTNINRVTPAGGWLLNGSGFHKKKLSPPDVKNQDSMKFPFRVSPPPPPDRPASPIPLVDDIDQPSTSSRETVAERNIRLDMERKLTERSPPERVVQRTSAGKVKGPFCTKGMNTNDSPLRRLSICDEGEEVGSPQARRKLSFVRQNGHDGDQPLVECPVCKCYFEGCDINKHLDECVPSPIKKPDDGENDDEMACPICGLWQPKDTVAAHADECAQKRYGA